MLNKLNYFNVATKVNYVSFKSMEPMLSRHLIRLYERALGVEFACG